MLGMRLLQTASWYFSPEKSRDDRELCTRRTPLRFFFSGCATNLKQKITQSTSKMHLVNFRSILSSFCERPLTP